MPGTVDVAGGLLDLHETDALAIAQNQGTCLVFTMPREAIRRDAARFVTPPRLNRRDDHGPSRQWSLGEVASRSNRIDRQSAPGSPERGPNTISRSNSTTSPQYESELITSPPEIEPRPTQIWGLMEFFIK
jgi:CheB methylesterase